MTSCVKAIVVSNLIKKLIGKRLELADGRAWGLLYLNGATTIGSIRYQQVPLMAPKTHIFFAGATGMLLYLYPDLCNSLSDLGNPDISGYVGGTVLQRLLAHPKRDTFEITALVRNVDKAKLLNTLGVNTIIASLSDFDKVAEACANSDVVINLVILRLIRVGLMPC